MVQNIRVDHLSVCLSVRPQRTVAKQLIGSGRRKMQDWNLADQIAGLENAGLENA